MKIKATQKSKKQVILATQSTQRQELFKSLGIKFEIKPADLDELAIDDIDHAKRAAKVALAKASKISGEYPSAIVVAADTFIVFENQRLEKPLDVDEARQMLQQISGQTVEVHTGWAYLDPALSLEVSETSTDRLSFRSLSEAEIETYITSYPVTRWAGAFTLSHMPGISMISSLQGSLTSVLGIPIEALIPHLKTSGVLV